MVTSASYLRSRVPPGVGWVRTLVIRDTNVKKQLKRLQGFVGKIKFEHFDLKDPSHLFLRSGDLAIVWSVLLDEMLG